MKCNEVHLLLTDLHLGDLKADLRSQVEDHLVRCSDCRSRLEAVRESVGAFRDLEEEESQLPAPPVDIQAITSSKPPRTGKPPILQWARRAAAALLMALGLATLFGIQVEAREGGMLVAFSLPGMEQELPDKPVENPPAPPKAEIDPEEVRLAVDQAVQTTLRPAFVEIQNWMVETQKRHSEQLAGITRLLEERRQEDAKLFSSELADTRRNLEFTQETLIKLAQLFPLNTGGR